MEFVRAREIIEEMADAGVTGISFTAGEPLLFKDDLRGLIRVCGRNRIYTRVVTNGFWAHGSDHAEEMVCALVESGLSQMRLSTSRWHQENVKPENIVRAAAACRKQGLDCFVSFITDFSREDDALEAFLQEHQLRYFPEPVIYFGRAESFDRKRIFTDYAANTCSMNAYLSPNEDMYACCDAGNRFSETGFLYLGNLRRQSVDELLKKKEQHPLYHLIRTVGLTPMASFLGCKASEIVRYRKCEICEMMFNSKENVKKLEKGVGNLLKRRRN